MNASRRRFITDAALATAAMGTPHPATAASAKLPRTTPEAEGVDPAGVLAFLDTVEKKGLGLHSLMLLRHGKVYAEGGWAPYGPAHPHMLYSLSKSFTSTAVGLAIAEGKLTLDDKVTSFFPESLPSKVEANLAAMQVRHLLMMGTGHDTDTTGAVLGSPDGDWVKTFLSLPVQHAPASKFVYNTGATYMLSAIIQKVSGQTTLDYLKPRLFAPLGIQNPTWETCPKGRSTGGFGLSITTEDIARFGQLYLQKGRWDGKQLVPERWVTEATTKHIVNGDPAAASDWTQGYGYQFWRCRHEAFRGDGAFGQFCIVLPQHDAVVALTSGANDLQGIVNAVWEHLLPALQASRPAAQPALAKRLKQLALPLAHGLANAPTAKPMLGKVYRFESNPQGIKSLQLTGSHVVLETEKGAQKLAYSGDRWTRGTADLDTYPSKKVATRGAWPTPETLTLTVCAYETPFIHTLTCQFVGDQVSLSVKTNVSFGPAARPTLVGRVG